MLTLKPLLIDWSVAGATIPAVTFIAQAGFPTRELAYMLDSLVRVSRRVECNHLVNVLMLGCALARFSKSPQHCHQTRMYNSRSSSAKCFHIPGGALPYTWRFPRMRIDGDAQGKKHSGSSAGVYSNAYAYCSRHLMIRTTILPTILMSFAFLSAISGTLNSLFKVLFIFPSWYLFAIGLEPIFSFR